MHPAQSNDLITLEENDFLNPDYQVRTQNLKDGKQTWRNNIVFSLILIIILVVIGFISFKVIEEQAEIAKLKQVISQVTVIAKTNSLVLRKQEYLTTELLAINSSSNQKPGSISVQRSPWIIDLGQKNALGEDISHVLYKSEQDRQKRINFHINRMKLISSKSQYLKYQSLNLINHNLRINSSFDDLYSKQQEEDYRKANLKHHLQDINTELPICILISGLNNELQNRIQYNLNSIFTQNYSNYFVVLTNDASYDRSDEIYRKYLSFYNISKEKYVYIQNNYRKTALENHYIALTNYCSEDSIAIIVDGDDELIGRNTLKILNAVHQHLQAGVVYSNYYQNYGGQEIRIGMSKDYPLEEKKQQLFRKYQLKYSHLKSWKTSLFRTIDKSQFLDQDGLFYKSACDLVIFMPLLERACGRIYFIDQFHYLYNGMTGANDHFLNFKLQDKVFKTVRSQPKLNCSKTYESIPLYESYI